MNIGDFAEQLLTQSTTAPKLPQSSTPEFNPTDSFLPTQVGQQAPDISNVEVPSNFVADLLEGRDTEVQEEQVQPPAPSQSLEENELHTLLSEVKALLEEVKVQLVEATTCGSIGTNQGGASTKETEEEDPMQRILKTMRKRKKAAK